VKYDLASESIAGGHAESAAGDTVSDDADSDPLWTGQRAPIGRVGRFALKHVCFDWHNVRGD
jgi:hypothetical protein